MRYVFFLTSFAFTAVLSAQPGICATSATPSIVRVEGLAERVGDIVYSCTGAPNSNVTVNFSISLNTNISNRISSGNTLTGLIFTVDNGSGPQPILVSPLLASQNTLVYNGVSLTFSPQGSLILHLAGIRANANGNLANNQIVASLSGGLLLNSTQLVVGAPERGLYVSYSTDIVCAQNGSPLPNTINFTNLILENTSFASTRITEGFAGAFAPKSAPANLNADTGERFIIQYSGFPSDASLLVPDVVAGSDAVQPTAGGDFGPPASGGAYAPSLSGSLLLARVQGADANGGGGTPVYIPGAIGSGTVTFNTVSPLQFVNGATYVVYEVVDANPSAVESAQYPTFLGLPFDGSRNTTETSSDVFFAPQSTVVDASAISPIPRFAAVTPPTDCSIIGDCATYLPHLTVDVSSFQFTATAGAATQQGTFLVINTGGGMMPWTASITYGNGSGWLSLDTNSADNSATVRIYAVPGSLTPGKYTATVTINAGQTAGTLQIPVTFMITPAPPPAVPTPMITSVLNSASLNPVPVVPGSMTTIMGSAFNGSNLTVTFNNLAATIVFNNDSQINLVVPAGLAGQTTAQLVVSAGGVSSVPSTVSVAPFEPAIFNGAILNQDGTVNGPTLGASAGSIIAIWATGLSGAGTITGNIDNIGISSPAYAGPAPGIAGVQQINLMIPANLQPMTTQVYVCGTSFADASITCSIPVPLTIQ
ncbi:MAG: IPT/TIG domain-containing protein [Bryobacteraceae bacterium]